MSRGRNGGGGASRLHAEHRVPLGLDPGPLGSQPEPKSPRGRAACGATLAPTAVHFLKSPATNTPTFGSQALGARRESSVDWAGAERPLVQTAPCVGHGRALGAAAAHVTQGCGLRASRCTAWLPGEPCGWGDSSRGFPPRGSCIPSVQLRKSEPKGSSGGPGGSAASTPAQSLEEDGKSRLTAFLLPSERQTKLPQKRCCRSCV